MQHFSGRHFNEGRKRWGAQPIKWQKTIKSGRVLLTKDLSNLYKKPWHPRVEEDRIIVEEESSG